MSVIGEAGTPSSPGAGWYLDTTGAMRWWDGRAWGPAAPVPADDRGRTWAVICHLSWVAMPIVPSIVLRLVVGRDDRFTRHHANEALNAQIWFAIVWNASIVPMIVAINSAETPPWFWVPIATLVVCWVTLFAFSVLAAVRASQGRYWRYPLPFRFTRGSVRDGAPGSS